MSGAGGLLSRGLSSGEFFPREARLSSLRHLYKELLSKGLLCRGLCPMRVFVLGGLLPWEIFPGGFCPRDFCLCT